VRGPDGNAYLYHNDESNHGGSCRWQISGWDDITEMDGTSTIGSTVNLSSNTAGPIVTITSPLPGTVDSNGSNLTLSAQAASSGAAISSVQFMDGAKSLGTVSAAPFTLNYSGFIAGSHVITAIATDANGLSTTSAPVNISVTGDGTSAPPPVPVSLSAGDVSSQSVNLSWTEPSIGTTSSTIGRIISFQCASVGNVNDLKPTDIAGAPPYAVANFNLFGQASVSNPGLLSAVDSAGTSLNLGICSGVSGLDTGNSTQSLTGTAQKMFAEEISIYSSVLLSDIAYPNYDLVVYTLPGGIVNGTQTDTISVSNGLNASSTVQESFSSLPKGYTVATVPFGTNSTVSNVNAVVFQGLGLQSFSLKGNNIAAFQIVERPYDEGVPASYNIQRALGTSGTFVTIGTASGSALNFVDTSSLAPATTYQYRIQAVDSFGASAYSNTVSVTTGAPGSTSYTAWQAQYFTPEQLADPTISGATADPYGSGVPNLLAYALQLNPATAKTTDAPNPTVNNGHLSVTYFAPFAIADINYVVEVSSDLQNWNSGPGYTQTVSSVVVAGGTNITVQDTLPTTTPKHFMRVRVTQSQ